MTYGRGGAGRVYALGPIETTAGRAPVIPKVERLVNLTVALLEARRPLSFAELRQRTGFYAQDDPESARRMFERDKDELRRLGVPIEVRDLLFGDEVGYVVSRVEYEVPDVDLTAEEVAALAVALQLTGTEGTRLALAKLAARAPDPLKAGDAPPVRVAVAPDPVDAVADAVVSRTALRFTYRTAAGDVRERTVDPYGVVQRRGSWYLVGRDHDRDAVRAFRLDRIETRPQTVGSPGAFDHPDDLDVAAAVTGPETETVDVEVAVTDEARWAVELRGGTDTGRRHGELPVLEVPGVDPVRDRSWLLGLGPQVEVLSPASLRDEVVAALRRVADGPGDVR